MDLCRVGIVPVLDTLIRPREMTIHVCEQGLFIRSLLTKLRDEKSDKLTFRKNAEILGDLLMMELINGGLIPIRTDSVLRTPTNTLLTNGVVLLENVKICIVPIIRAGLSFLNSVFRVLQINFDVGHLVIQRNEETAEPMTLLDQLPTDLGGYDKVIVLDPMLATGGSVVSAIDCIIAKGVAEDKIVVVHAVAAPEGLSFLQKRFPKISGVIGVVDEQLNEKKYIVPGLGDWGDRFN